MSVNSRFPTSTSIQVWNILLSFLQPQRCCEQASGGAGPDLQHLLFSLLANTSATADLKDQTDVTGAQLGGDADHGLQQGAQSGFSTPPARRPGSCAHLWSPIHRSNVINCQGGQKG